MLTLRLAFVICICSSVSTCAAGQITSAGHTSAVVPASNSVQYNLIGIDKNGYSTNVYDFGTVRKGVKISHVFTIRNDSSNDILLDRADSFCDCTSAIILSDFKAEPILKPGMTARVQVTLDTGKMPASTTTAGSSVVHKSVYVYAVGEPVHAAVVLQMQGRISLGVSFDPPVLSLGSVATEKGSKQIVSVKIDKDVYVPGKTRLAVGPESPLRISELPAKADGTTANTVVQKYVVAIPAHTPIQSLTGSLALIGISSGADTNPATADAFLLPYVGKVVGQVTAEPDTAMFGVVHARDAFGKSVLASDARQQRIRWILLLNPALNAQNGNAFWRRATAHTASSFAADFVAPLEEMQGAGTDTSAGEAVPPSLASAHLHAGTAYWLKVTMLPSAPRGVWLSEPILVNFPNGEVVKLSAQGQVE